MKLASGEGMLSVWVGGIGKGIRRNTTAEPPLRYDRTGGGDIKALLARFRGWLHCFVPLPPPPTSDPSRSANLKMNKVKPAQPVAEETPKEYKYTTEISQMVRATSTPAS